MLLFRWAQCRSAQPLLWDYASERLSEEMMERVEQHLHRCASCHKELDSLKRAQGLLAACRAQEEPAPRSDWNDLQQRLVADGLAQITPSSAKRHVQNPDWRERIGMTARAPWTLQLATSAAGGFAAVLVLALGYNALHLRNAPGAAGLANTTPFATPRLAAVTPSVTTAPSPDETAQNAQLVTGLIKFLNAVPTNDNSVAGNAMPAKALHESGSSTPPMEDAGIRANARHNERKLESRLVRAASRVTSHASAFAAHNISADKIVAAVKDSRNVRRSNSKSKARPSDAPLMQVASRYVLEHVQPVGTDGDEANGYVVGAVRPIARDDEGVY